MIRDFFNEEQCAGETKPVLVEEADFRQSRINDHSLGAHLSRSSDQPVDQKFGNPFIASRWRDYQVTQKYVPPAKAS
jgi:hypothetical protein